MKALLFGKSAEFSQEIQRSLACLSELIASHPMAKT